MPTMRETAARRIAALRATAPTIAQCALATGLAWLLARELLGHEQPFFAPVAALLTLGLSSGQRGRRAVELAIGVALGIGIGDLLVLAIGTGWWQIGLVVALAMAAAILLAGGALLVTQAAISAVLVATLQPPDDGLSAARVLDALVGGAMGLAVTAIGPSDPLRLVRLRAEPVLGELAGSLEDIAAALERRDRAAAERALDRARAIDPASARLREALAAGRETARLAPGRRRARGPLAVYAAAAGHVELAIRNARVLARAAVRAIDLDERVPPRTIGAIVDLAIAVRGLADELAGSRPAEHPETAALRAAACSTAALEETANLSASVIVGQVRMTATDLLRGLGMDHDEALAAVRDARAQLGV